MFCVLFRLALPSSGLKSLGKGVVGGTVGLIAAPIMGATTGGVAGFAKGIATGGSSTSSRARLASSFTELWIADESAQGFRVLCWGFINQSEVFVESYKGKAWDQ
eukprot:gene1069-1405_t